MSLYILQQDLINKFNFYPFLSSASNELVLINFYADWCRFSNMLAPIFDEAADKVTADFNEPGQVVMGKVDCDKEGRYILLHFISLYSYIVHIFYYPILYIYIGNIAYLESNCIKNCTHPSSNT